MGLRIILNYVIFTWRLGRLLEGLNQGPVETLRAQVGLGVAAVLDELLQQKIVGGGTVIMSVSLKTFPGQFRLEPQLRSLPQYLVIDRDPVVPDNNPVREVHTTRRTAPPLVLPYLLDVEPFTWVRVQNVGQHVFRVVG